MTEPNTKRIVLIRNIAKNWIEKQATPEYRFRVFNPSGKDYVSIIKSFRDGKIKLASVDPLPGVGIEENFEGFTVWGSDLKALRTLSKFFEKKGLETTWIW